MTHRTGPPHATLRRRAYFATLTHRKLKELLQGTVIATRVKMGYEILERNQIAPDTVQFRIHCPHIARAFRPGQFLMLKHNASTAERIPLSVADYSAAEGTITIVVMAVGRTSTEIVRDYKAGTISSASWDRSVLRSMSRNWTELSLPSAGDLAPEPSIRSHAPSEKQAIASSALSGLAPDPALCSTRSSHPYVTGFW